MLNRIAVVRQDAVDGWKTLGYADPRVGMIVRWASRGVGSGLDSLSPSDTLTISNIGTNTNIITLVSTTSSLTFSAYPWEVAVQYNDNTLTNTGSSPWPTLAYGHYVFQ